MQRALLLKALLVVVLLVLLHVPLTIIDGLIDERAARQREVVATIASTSFGRQVFAGPVLSIPYVEEYDEAVSDGNRFHPQRQRIERTARFFPDAHRLDGQAVVHVKSRGVFKARVFEWRAAARGEFVFDGSFEPVRSRPGSTISWGRPTVGMMIADPRGLVGSPALSWASEVLALERGSALPGVASGLHARVPVFDPLKQQRFPYAIDLTLQGTESLSLVPLARDDQTHLTSSWPHPSFGGQFLPQSATQVVSDAGFDARWNISALASKAQQQITALFDSRQACADIWCTERIEVRFIDPVDVYTLSDRAVKYGMLFVALTFGCFALFEVIRTLQIHPAQYLLVGLALTIFFLLLIALSEHVAFWIAYATAAVACLALIVFYLAAVLGGGLRALGFGGMLAALYAALYGLLVSEDNALLLGSLLVFGILGAAMIATRRLDWYRIGSK